MQLIVQREKVDRERPNTGERWRRAGEDAFCFQIRQETNSRLNRLHSAIPRVLPSRGCSQFFFLFTFWRDIESGEKRVEERPPHPRRQERTQPHVGKAKEHV